METFDRATSWFDRSTVDEQKDEEDVVMTTEGRGGVALEIRVINFDFAGELGEVKYPQSLN